MHSSSKADDHFIIGRIVMSKNGIAYRLVAAAMGVAMGSLALTGLAAKPASAASVPAAAPPAAELPVTGGVFAEVQQAPTSAEKKAILESNGFVNTSGNTYELSKEGLTIGVSVPDEPREDVVWP
jgi:hypothetical protein